MDKFQCWAMQRDDIIALAQESDRWKQRIDAMTPKWIQLNVGQNEKPTTDEHIHEADAPGSLPTLPVEETESAIKPSNNPYSLISNDNSPQVDKTIDMKPEKQLEEPSEEPVPAEQTITVTEDEPREDTGADTTIEKNTQPVPTSGQPTPPAKNEEIIESLMIRSQQQQVVFNSMTNVHTLRKECLENENEKATARALQEKCLEIENMKLRREIENKKQQQTINKMKRTSQQQQERINNFWDSISKQAQMMPPQQPSMMQPQMTNMMQPQMPMMQPQQQRRRLFGQGQRKRGRGRANQRPPTTNGMPYGGNFTPAPMVSPQYSSMMDPQASMIPT